LKNARPQNRVSDAVAPSAGRPDDCVSDRRPVVATSAGTHARPRTNERTRIIEAVELQRRRILDAMVLVVREHGFAGASVSRVSARAKVSRRTFNEAFDSLEDCFLAVLDEGAAHASALISEAFDLEGSWVDGVRGALAALLGFFDSEPARAHALVVEANAAGPRARGRREQHVASIISLIEDRWRVHDENWSHPLDAAGVMGSLLAVLHTHLVTARKEPMIALLGPAMGLVTAPYLNQRCVKREIERAEAIAAELLARRACAPPAEPAGSVTLPELLLHPRAHRARACILHLAMHPEASNREVARAVGIERDTHISTLLARLHRAGLLVKRRAAPGRPNEWSASSYGMRVANVLQVTQQHETSATPPQAITLSVRPTLNTTPLHR
jgi:AcrR family transcriptional regulator